MNWWLVIGKWRSTGVYVFVSFVKLMNERRRAKEDTKHKAPTVLATVQGFNTLSRWVQTVILGTWMSA